MTALDVADSVPPVPRDRRVTLGGRKAKLQFESVVLFDSLNIAQALKPNALGSSIKLPGSPPEQLAKPFFKDCEAFIHDCGAESLPKLGVEACLYYSRTAFSFQPYCRSVKKNCDQASDYVLIATKLLEKAKEWCSRPFENADGLRRAVEESAKLLGREWYEEVSAVELAAIKAAMTSGQGGMATHSGHWYNCANGHPFAIGECGMPMELARCPECGAPIGGQNHREVQGVTRATAMED
ncbi:MAG: hypothetical protein M1826_007673 [Phylliscum demangeonii]|nr:MAG: hypothetical protein M1826_007673 [Phylliscum demangeonii]